MLICQENDSVKSGGNDDSGNKGVKSLKGKRWVPSIRAALIYLHPSNPFLCCPSQK